MSVERERLVTLLGVRLGLVTTRQVAEAAAGERPGDLLDRLAARGVLTPAQRRMLDGMAAAALRAPGAEVLARDAARAVRPEAEAPGVTREHPGRYVALDREEGTEVADPGRAELRRQGAARVLLALDRHLGRRVALKVVPAGDAALTEELAREARVTGQLEHPGIVPVYELGRRTDGAVYCSQQLIGGRTLAEALAAQAGLAGRLTLVPHLQAVCHAIAFAHSRGVAHGGLCSESVRVGRFGEAVVLDWGRAQVNACQPAGERERAEREDVRALGGLLHELLAGRPREEPRSPVREACPEAPADLAAVCERALEGGPAGYRSARELAGEIGAYLAGGRVRAHSYTPWELLRRWAGRHTRVVALGAAMVAVVLAALGVSFLRVAGERDTALAERAEAMGFATFLVTDLFDDLEKLAGSTQSLERVVNTSLEYLDASAGQAGEGFDDWRSRGAAYSKLAVIVDRMGRRADALRAAHRAQEALRIAHDLRPGDREVRAALALATARVADLTRAIEGTRAGLPIAREAVALAEPLLSWGGPLEVEALWQASFVLGSMEAAGGDPAALLSRLTGFRELLLSRLAGSPQGAQLTRLLDGLVQVNGKISQLHAQYDRLPQAIEAGREALASGERLAALEPANARHQLGLARTLQRLAGLEWGSGARARAEEHLQRALAALQALAIRDPDDQEAAIQLASGQRSLAEFRLHQGQIAEARGALDQAARLLRGCAAREGEDRERLAVCALVLELRVELELGEGRIGEARQWADRAVQIDRLQVARDPGNQTFHQNLLAGQTSLGAMALWSGEVDVGVEALERALVLAEDLTARQPGEPSLEGDRSAVRLMLAGALASRGEDVRARALADQSRGEEARRLQAVPGDEASAARLADSQLLLASLDLAQGAQDAWPTRLREAVALLARAERPAPDGRVALAHLLLGEEPRARQLLDQALGEAEASPEARVALVPALAAAGRYADALGLGSAALAAAGEDRRSRVVVHSFLALAGALGGRPLAAREHALAGARLADSLPGPLPWQGWTLVLHRQAMARLAHLRAAPARDLVQALVEWNLGGHGPRLAEALRRFARDAGRAR